MRGIKRFHIVVAEPYAPEALDRLRQLGDVTVLPDSSPQSILSAMGDCDVLCVRQKAHVTARIIDGSPQLKVIARAGPNLDHIDLRAAGRRNIRVVYAPNVGVTSTAQFALGLILALHRRVPLLDREVRLGHFDSLRTPVLRDMGHARLGLLGVDAVAIHLAKMCRTAFATTIVYHDPVGTKAHDIPAEAATLDDLLASADILSVHLPAGPDSKHFLNAERLARLKPTTVLVNVSKGSVIDTVALADALRAGRLAGAALDVFELEPLPRNHPIRRAPNCLLTPHVASSTLNAVDDRFAMVAEDVARILNGEAPQHGAKLPADL